MAAKYYLASRGGRGTLNPPHYADYSGVNPISSPSLDNPKTAFKDVRNLLNPADRNYSGWAVVIHHLVKNRQGQQKFFDFYRENSKDIVCAK